jgi:cobalt/nickel transport protein
VNGTKQDLLATLRETRVMDHTAWQADYAIKRPGVYTFYMEPEPFWEPAEESYL